MKKMIIIAAIALVLVVGGIVAFLLLSGNSTKEVELELLSHKLPEIYTNIKNGEEEDKILKIQPTIIYTDEDFTEVFTKKQDMIVDFINGYFRDKDVETVNRKNGKERVKEDVTEQLIEMLETDNENIKEVVFPQFIIQ